MDSSSHYRMLHVRIRKETYKKYQIKCIENNLSLPKQTEQLIKDFVKDDRIEIPFDVVENIKK